MANLSKSHKFLTFLAGYYGCQARILNGKLHNKSQQCILGPFGACTKKFPPSTPSRRYSGSASGMRLPEAPTFQGRAYPSRTEGPGSPVGAYSSRRHLPYRSRKIWVWHLNPTSCRCALSLSRLYLCARPGVRRWFRREGDPRTSSQHTTHELDHESAYVSVAASDDDMSPARRSFCRRAG